MRTEEGQEEEEDDLGKKRGEGVWKKKRYTDNTVALPLFYL